MRKTLAIVLVVAFVLGLGSVVWATQNNTNQVEGWGSFYSTGGAEVELVRPVLYDSTGDGTLWVDVQVKSDGNTVDGNVKVYDEADHSVAEKGYATKLVPLNTVDGTTFTGIGSGSPYRVQAVVGTLPLNHVIVVEVTNLEGT